MVGEFLQVRLPIGNAKWAPKLWNFPPHDFNYDCSGALVWQASVDRTLRKYVTVAFRTRILYISYHPTLPGHPRKLRMYDTMRHQLFCLHKANDVIRQRTIATHAPKVDFKRSISVSSHYYQLLEHSSLGPFIYWNHYRNQPRVSKTWFVWLTTIQNSPVQFPKGKSHRHILWVYYSTIVYFCMGSQTMHWMTTVHCLSASFSQRYASSQGKRSQGPLPNIGKQSHQIASLCSWASERLGCVQHAEALSDRNIPP